MPLPPADWSECFECGEPVGTGNGCEDCTDARGRGEQEVITYQAPVGGIYTLRCACGNTRTVTLSRKDKVEPLCPKCREMTMKCAHGWIFPPNCKYCHQEKPMHPATEHLLQFFTYSHLPADLQDVSRPLCELAHALSAALPANQETTACLRKLLEAKDCAVRAHLAG